MAFKDLNVVGINEIRYTIAYLTGRLIDLSKASIIMDTLDDVTCVDNTEQTTAESFMEHLKRFYPTEIIKMKFDCTNPEESLRKVSDWVDKYHSDFVDETPYESEA